MKIPRHWAKVEEKFTASEDIEYALRVWGVSSVSPADAEADARRRMQALLARMRDGYHPDGNLCRVQDCFRARLTPKPWRIGLPQPKVSFPLEESSRARLETWLAGYEQKRQAWSVCRLVEAIGPDATRPEIRAIVAHHDDACGLASRLPLA